MAKAKGDIEIGFRAYEECRRLAGYRGLQTLARKLRIDRKCFNEWKYGGTPSSLALAKLHYAGADVLYILTGKRSEK